MIYVPNDWITSCAAIFECHLIRFIVPIRIHVPCSVQKYRHVIGTITIYVANNWNTPGASICKYHLTCFKVPISIHVPCPIQKYRHVISAITIYVANNWNTPGVSICKYHLTCFKVPISIHVPVPIQEYCYIVQPTVNTRAIFVKDLNMWFSLITPCRNIHAIRIITSHVFRRIKFYRDTLPDRNALERIRAWLTYVIVPQ